MNSPITICVITYNRKKILKTLLDYLIRNKTELIIIKVFNNGSFDGTTEYLYSLESKKIIELYNEEKNIGISNIIKIAIKTVKTEFFQILCDDDFVNINFIYSAYAKLQNDRSIGWLGSKSLIWYEKEKDYRILGLQWSTNTQNCSQLNIKKFFKYNIPLCAILFRSSAINDNFTFNDVADEKILIGFISTNYKFKIINILGGCFTVSKFSFSGIGGIKKYDINFIENSLKKDLQNIEKYTKKNLLKTLKTETIKNYNNYRCKAENKKNLKNYMKKILIYFNFHKFFYYIFYNELYNQIKLFRNLLEKR